jgi:hypothetical protein
LRKSVGGVVPRGAPLFEVAPLDGMILEIRTPESVAPDVQPGQTGEFAGHARPEQVQPFRVTRVHAAAEIQNGQSRFVVEAALAAPAAWLRPGMEGVARIHAGRRRAWWVMLHRAIDAVRMQLWF